MVQYPTISILHRHLESYSAYLSFVDNVVQIRQRTVLIHTGLQCFLGQWQGPTKTKLDDGLFPKIFIAGTMLCSVANCTKIFCKNFRHNYYKNNKIFSLDVSQKHQFVNFLVVCDFPPSVIKQKNNQIHFIENCKMIV